VAQERKKGKIVKPSTAQPRRGPGTRLKGRQPRNLRSQRQTTTTYSSEKEEENAEKSHGPVFILGRKKKESLHRFAEKR